MHAGIFLRHTLFFAIIVDYKTFALENRYQDESEICFKCSQCVQDAFCLKSKFGINVNPLKIRTKKKSKAFPRKEKVIFKAYKLESLITCTFFC